MTKSSGDYGKLIERLCFKDWRWFRGEKEEWLRNPEGPEAATAISTLLAALTTLVARANAARWRSRHWMQRYEASEAKAKAAVEEVERLTRALEKVERKAKDGSDWNKRTGGPGAVHNTFAEIIQTSRAALSATQRGLSPTPLHE